MDIKKIISKDANTSVNGEELAAIAAAIYMFNSELHDKESCILTFQTENRSWTPWNARYFGMNNYSKKK